MPQKNFDHFIHSLNGLFIALLMTRKHLVFRIALELQCQTIFQQKRLTVWYIYFRIGSSLGKDCVRCIQKHSVSIAVYSFATREQSNRRGKTQKRIQNSRLTNKTPFQILFPIQLYTFFSPSGLADKKIRVTCRGVNTWMTALGVAPWSSTASVHQQSHSRRSSRNTLGSEESTPINLSVSVGTQAMSRWQGRYVDRHLQ